MFGGRNPLRLTPPTVPGVPCTQVTARARAGRYDPPPYPQHPKAGRKAAAGHRGPQRPPCGDRHPSHAALLGARPCWAAPRGTAGPTRGPCPAAARGAGCSRRFYPHLVAGPNFTRALHQQGKGSRGLGGGGGAAAWLQAGAVCPPRFWGDEVTTRRAVSGVCPESNPSARGPAGAGLRGRNRPY